VYVLPSWLRKLAGLFSLIGHPLLTLSLFSVYVAFRQLPLLNAVTVAGLLVGGVALPVSWHNYRQVRRGRYSNFDVSDRRQRAGFYPVLIGLMAAVTGLLVVTDQPRPFWYGAVCMLGLLIGSYAANRFLKVSLHASLSFFLAGAMYLLSPPLGIGMAVLAVLVAASRLILNRHTLAEILVGVLMGLATGAGFYSLVA
jgi:membrane-associated phospholipid phosphatase